MTASPTARINFAGAAEVVDSLQFRPITDTFVRAAEVDPRRTRVCTAQHQETT